MKSDLGTKLLPLLLLTACATQQRIAAPLPAKLQLAQAPAPAVSDIRLSAANFNPAIGETISFTFTANTRIPLVVAIWDADGGLIRALPVVSTPGKPMEISWDGKDSTGIIVPDEAYTFTVRDARGSFLYNPFSISGGERIDVTEVDWRPKEQRLIYRLPAPCRMLVRAGTKPGPLFANIVDWEPRHAREVIEKWDGLDSSEKVYVPGQQNFLLTLSGYKLPESTVLTYGQDKTTFMSYRKKHPALETMLSDWRNSRGKHVLYGKPLASIRSPKVHVELEDGSSPKEIRIKDGEQFSLVIFLDDVYGPIFQLDRFEITMFIDDDPYMEEGQPYLPYIFPVKAKYFSPGTHLVTINVSNFSHQSAEFSLVVRKE